jgi:Arc/MetJ-type ribon-helix-helix transcriptional regulator
MEHKITFRTGSELRSDVHEFVEESPVYSSIAEFARHAVAEKLERERGG